MYLHLNYRSILGYNINIIIYWNEAGVDVVRFFVRLVWVQFNYTVIV